MTLLTPPSHPPHAAVEADVRVATAQLSHLSSVWVNESYRPFWPVDFAAFPHPPPLPLAHGRPTLVVEQRLNEYTHPLGCWVLSYTVLLSPVCLAFMIPMWCDPMEWGEFEWNFGLRPELHGGFISDPLIQPAIPWRNRIDPRTVVLICSKSLKSCNTFLKAHPTLRCIGI